LSPHLIDFLKSYHWPGNIRELRNVLERAILLSRGNPLTKEHFPGLDKTAFSQDLTNEFTNLKKLEELHINQALHKYNGNIEKAAKELGLSRATLYRKIKKHNIKIPKSSTNA
jgi:transcriptional regulator of acetoin/glycerol metabolism